MATRLMAAQEHRREPRIAERISLAIAEAGGELSADTKNLSASGAYCTLDRFIAPMTKVQLRFTLPQVGAQPAQIRCPGVIVRIEPVIASAERGRFNVAVLFTELSERDRSAIQRFVRERIAATRP